MKAPSLFVSRACAVRIFGTKPRGHAVDWISAATLSVHQLFGRKPRQFSDLFHAEEAFAERFCFSDTENPPVTPGDD